MNVKIQFSSHISEFCNSLLTSSYSLSLLKRLFIVFIVIVNNENKKHYNIPLIFELPGLNSSVRMNGLRKMSLTASITWLTSALSFSEKGACTGQLENTRCPKQLTVSELRIIKSKKKVRMSKNLSCTLMLSTILILQWYQLSNKKQVDHLGLLNGKTFLPLKMTESVGASWEFGGCEGQPTIPPLLPPDSEKVFEKYLSRRHRTQLFNTKCFETWQNCKQWKTES